VGIIKEEEKDNVEDTQEIGGMRNGKGK